MSASGFFRVKKLKGAAIVLAASRHNKRTIQAEHGADGHIDADRICLNLSLHGPDKPEAVARHAKNLMSAACVRPQKKNAVLALELIFSLPPATAIDPEAFFRDCLQWAAQNFGGLDNVLSADVHLDESAPHLHVLILPLIDGRMNGSDLVGNKQRLQFLHNDVHTAVGARYGLAKAPARLQGQAKEKTAQAVIQRLRATNDTAQASALWPVLRDMIDRDPAPFAQSLGIDIATPTAKTPRTMAQIFTSKGKGLNKPSKPIGFATRPMPIGIDDAANPQTLSCVGIADKPPPAAQAERPAIKQHQHDDDRVIDRSDCEFSDWQDFDQLEHHEH
ncbi:plasmid recombination protein [Rhodoferax sp.]|uniref:plasmid recombination protein n=1 Tax=Rhodoferax sp. TaxID=50421 RepID=UPI00276CBE10|nr:plasmid recombination protein [Rhodoferax sp.]